MSWSHSLQIPLAAFVLLGFVWLIRQGRRRRNRFRRDVLPPPSDRCRRRSVEAVP